MSEPRIAFLEHVENGVLTDATSVTLADPSGTWGIREAVSENIVVPPNTPVVRVDVGMYEYDISSLNPGIEYEIFWKVIDTGGNTEYILGIIPIQQVEGAGSGGPAVPADILEDESRRMGLDCDDDGYIDGYAYDLDGDGYFEAFDWNNDTIIDQVDVGTLVYPPGIGHVTGRSRYDGNEVFDHRGRRICNTCSGTGYVSGHTCGTCHGTGYVGVVEPPDGIPDVPSPRGTPAEDGVWGSTKGYDGTSGYVPATGGARTNRADCDEKPGDGFWDGISFEGLCTIPIGPRGQCLKDKAHAYTRVMLKDTDPSCAAFSDDEIDMYLEMSLAAFNAKPTFTAFLWDNLQERWLDIIAKGGTIWALYAQGLIEAGREFTITDNGISFTPPPVSDKLHAYAAALLAHYEKELLDIKQNFRPMPAAVGVFSVLDISPSLRRLRHLREKRIF